MENPGIGALQFCWFNLLHVLPPIWFTQLCEFPIEPWWCSIPGWLQWNYSKTDKQVGAASNQQYTTSIIVVFLISHMVKRVSSGILCAVRAELHGTPFFLGITHSNTRSLYTRIVTDYNDHHLYVFHRQKESLILPASHLCQDNISNWNFKNIINGTV